MKHPLIFLLLSVSSFAFSQSSVTILDSNVAYDSLSSQHLLTIFLSPPVSNADLSTLQVKVGSEYGASDVVNANYTIGTDVSVQYNQLQLPLSGVSAGQYVAVAITRNDATTQVMEYRMQ